MSNRRFVDVDGLRTRVFVHDGRPNGGRDTDAATVVLLHGAGGSYLIWPPALRRMDGVRVIVPDLPGHGESAGEAHADVAGSAAFVVRLLFVMEVERPIVIGHSLGAAIALTIARSGATDVAGVGVLAGGDRLPVSDALFDMVGNDYCAAVCSIAESSLESGIGERRGALAVESLRRLGAGVLQRDLMACRGFDARAWAHEVDVPALLIHGSDDRMVPLSCSRSLHERISHSDLHVLDGAGHLFLWSRTAETVQLVRAMFEPDAGARTPPRDQYGD